MPLSVLVKIVSRIGQRDKNNHACGLMTMFKNGIYRFLFKCSRHKLHDAMVY